MAISPKIRLTPEEYLVLERQAEFKSEYRAGEVYALAGASRRHTLIAGNVYGLLWTQLRRRPCEVYTGDMRIRIPRTGLYTYPDVAVIYGSPRFDDQVKDTLLNPTLVVEVLSDSTEKYDRGKKFENYRQIESFAEYVLIAQDEIYIEHYLRQPDVSWLYEEHHALADRLDLPSIDCHLLLADVYEKVTFETE